MDKNNICNNCSYGNKNNVCNNCNKIGHLFHNCKLPITSYGIILFRKNIEGIKFLMIRRKDSFGYIDFIRGKYVPHNIEQLQSIIDEMSIEEKIRIINDKFENLWINMWDNLISSQYKNEELSSSKKFDTIKNGVLVNNTIIKLDDIVKNSTTNWEETEWEFPKGRRNYQEKDLECALREFEEETGIRACDIKLIENVLPFEETFIGTNHKPYKHKYFLAYIDSQNNVLTNYQKTEVSKIEWKSIDECLKSIRPYNLEKIKIIKNIYKVLEEYCLYS